MTDTNWAVNATYYGANNGYAYVTPRGGTSPYTYNWSNSATTENISGLVQGTYYVTITDAIGCAHPDSVVVGSPALVANGDVDPVSANLLTAPAGTYVIAMDNTLQQSSGLFNVKAYGLITTLLNNKIALNWVIKSGKAKDSLDFTASVKPVFPTYSSTASSKSFYAGPFLIFPQDTTGNNIHTIVNTFNAANSSSPVYVYQLTTATTVDVRYVLTQIPKVAILNDGTNASIHVAYFTAASVPTSNYYVLASAVDLADSCYNFASEPHNDNPAGTVIDSIRSYVVNDGGNFLAECHAVWNYEDSTQGLFQSSAGINAVNTVVSPIVYGHPDLPFQQYQGAFDPTVTGGSVQNWVLNTGSSWINNTAIYQSGSGANAGIVGQSVSKLGNGAGHLVFYTGGHAYGTNNANNINGIRSYFNAMLTPSNVVKCNFLRFDNDLAVTESISVSNLYQLQRDTLKIVIVNNGPSQASANGVTVTDILPSSLSYVSYYTAKGSYNNSTGTWTVGTMSLTETDTLNIIVSGSVAGAFTNTVFVNKNLYDYYQNNDTARLSGTVYACSASAGPDVSQCGSSFTMAGNSPCTGTATWAVINGSATITTANSPTTGVTVATGVAATLTWTFTNGSAYSVDTVVLTNYSATVPTVNNATINCAGNSVTLTATANTSYHWGTGGTTQSISVTSGGTYTVTITNASGCTASANGTVTQIAALTASIAGTNINCYGGLTGAANLTVNGGTTPYTYLWSNSATTQNLSGKAAGTYAVTVTDNNLCTATSSVTLTQPAAALSASISGTNINCYGASTGAANLTVSGGTTPYTYLWSNSATTQNLTGKAAGTYTVTVTDNKACTISSSKTLTQPAAALTSSVSGTNIACYAASTGAVVQTVSGGTSPYTYLWSNSATTQNLSGSAAGTYTVTVTDNNLCTATSSVTLTQPAAALSASISGTNINCYGASTGAANLTVTGGTAPYTYLWNNSATTQNLSGKAAGAYAVTVTDNNLCTATSSVTLTQPAAALSASISGTNINCYGASTGAANLTVSGGTTPYTYLWSNSATTQNLSGKAAGTYTVTVTDNKACTISSSKTITQPAAALTSSVSGTNIACYGASTGAVAQTVSGGTTPYTYLWSNSATTQNLSANPAGTYAVTVTDNNLCTATSSVTLTQPAAALSASIAGTNINCYGASTGAANLTVTGGTTPYTYLWSNSATTQNLSGKAAGAYAVTVTDNNLCTATSSVTLTQPAAALSASISGTNINCYGASTGAANLTVSGGTTPYTYLWSNSATTQNLSGKAAGTYTVTVTDNKACTISSSKTITQPAAALTSSVSGTNIACYGASTGAVAQTVSGGTTPYTYLWSNSATTQNLSANPAGTYAVTVTDNNLCTATSSVTLTQPAAALSASIAGTNINCYGASTGAANLTVTGGTTTYSYHWSNGAVTQNLSGQAAGTYTVTVTDNNACTITSSKTLTQPPAALSASIARTNVSCYGGLTGAANLTVSGGTTPYTYHWSNSATTQNLAGIAAGTYTVTVTDQNACTTSSGTTVTQPAAAWSATAGSNSPVCYLDNLNFTASPSGMSSYAWTGPESYTANTQNPTRSSLDTNSTGVYSVTITDSYGCAHSASISATVTNRNSRALDWLCGSRLE